MIWRVLDRILSLPPWCWALVVYALVLIFGVEPGCCGPGIVDDFAAPSRY